MRGLQRMIWLAAAALFMSAASSQAGDRALLIGLDTYQVSKLSEGLEGSAGNDLDLILALLTGPYKYDRDAIKILKDSDATRDAILGQIGDWLVNATKQGDRVFLYFAGHGYFHKDESGKEKDGFSETIVPFDAVIEGDAKATIGGVITDIELSEAIGALEGRNVVVVLDTSHSGVVTRGLARADSIGAARVPRLGGATRSIVVEPAVKKQKEELGFLSVDFASGSIAIWSAVSPSQAALIDDFSGKQQGVFTALFVEAMREADANRNGVISNTELLAYIGAGAGKYCAKAGSRCEMGFTPRLDPESALAGVALFVASGPVASIADGAVLGQKAVATDDALTVDQLTDLLGKGNVDKVSLSQIPPSPVRVGQKDIRFQVLSPHEGHLILLDLSDNGDLTQLYPNQFSRKHESADAGRLLAGSPLQVPDAYYGLKFNATEPSKGHLVAIVTRGEVELPAIVKARSIEVIPREVARTQFLPGLVEALNKPVNVKDSGKNTEFAAWSVATLAYEIAP